MILSCFIFITAGVGAVVLIIEVHYIFFREE